MTQLSRYVKLKHYLFNFRQRFITMNVSRYCHLIHLPLSPYTHKSLYRLTSNIVFLSYELTNVIRKSRRTLCRHNFILFIDYLWTTSNNFHLSKIMDLFATWWINLFWETLEYCVESLTPDIISSIKFSSVNEIKAHYIRVMYITNLLCFPL